MIPSTIDQNLLRPKQYCCNIIHPVPKCSRVRYHTIWFGKFRYHFSGNFLFDHDKRELPMKGGGVVILERKN